MRGLPRWSAVLAVVAIAAVVCAFTVRRALKPAVLQLQISETVLPADGFTSAELKIRSTDGANLRNLRVETDASHRAVVESVTPDGSSATALLRAGVIPGDVTIQVTAAGHAPQPITLRTTLDTVDSIGDGTPDFLRLHDAADRAAFRRWFTLLAESQYYRRGALPPEINDCAALLRFTYREALRQHDSKWAEAMALPMASFPGEIRQYQFPFTPVAASVFRVRPGSFQEADLREGAFAEFADAETLWRRNTHFIGRDLARASPGDLLFFRQEGHDTPFHAMIFLGHSQIEPSSDQFVVYHTGPVGHTSGEIRRPSIAQLMNHPEARWHPVPSNPNFLGVYRWNILRGGD
jgi:hypothetical protein